MFYLFSSIFMLIIYTLKPFCYPQGGESVSVLSCRFLVWEGANRNSGDFYLDDEPTNFLKLSNINCYWKTIDTAEEKPQLNPHESFLQPKKKTDEHLHPELL